MPKTKAAFGARSLDLAFVSSNLAWGGSEYLWSEAALVLASAGHAVRVYKNRLSERETGLRKLRARADRFVELARLPLLPASLYPPLASFARPLDIGYQAVRLQALLSVGRRPDLAVISQGGNHDGWPIAGVCRRLKIPYVLISHKATDLYWPPDKWLSRVRVCYEEARHVFFVSEHSWRLTEEQLGRKLANASIVRNPFNVSWSAEPDWPEDGTGLRLACVGRLAPQEKGQDLLLRVFAAGKWRDRPVSLSFFGGGEHREGLEAMARFHGLGGVRFHGQEEDVAGIWRSHHALLLGSRAEGLPLVLVEAMLSARVPIVTDVGGNSELVSDGVTGFLAASPTEASIDAALERAWRRRGEWRRIGGAAAGAIRSLVPADPAADFADVLVRIAARPRLPGRPPRCKGPA
jgi:glycosyltransferase involved in cell wall biosynthesis